MPAGALGAVGNKCKGRHAAAASAHMYLFITCTWHARSQTLLQIFDSGLHELAHPMPRNCCALTANLACKQTALHLPGLSVLLSKGPC